ncbi:hypothetical protein DTO013E5_1372 [Penicillium roqueforti]|uniref:Genomic scaffold, ProqFM164S03 n=1 Tax=Penicillium roqueforti (strain FM164) TaxID=1365484 RepID=W6QA88_PENRF|nr:uncharacterized protein LCP9604111_5073 [Penicillium roqueforti]CDM33583.1 unnamed protein product [Penicillium roqueforti FM164]KAF9248834.1 hypothetical protein LCP9604111_5073 [Penicillium roqueforti]KAI1831710.1 hypothetical protein CBS147337_7520 [Penicillium roqueforti]KAI2681611.1 hypothetical protein CBS147355_2821 [Penicillium roqueforti]KAI2688999.1 hypothetical protein LCP963914a_2088 [Penicillium roqueforti]
MSIPVPEPRTTSVANGTSTNALSQGNVSQVPASNRSSVERFARAPASEGPYFANARMPERSAHLAALSSQLNAIEEIMKTGS